MLLNDEQTLIRDTARAFAQEQVAPHVRAWEAAGEIPRPLLAEMGRLGFMGMCVPAEWGGAGADMVSYVLARGEILGAFCLTEPQAGSDASNLRTRAERRGNGWVLTGTKQFITSGRTADMALVFAVTDPAAAK